MPPRIHLRAGASPLCLRSAPTPNGPLPITIVANSSSAATKRRHVDPYTLAQAKQRKIANEARQRVLKVQRTEALGDPVRGVPTPFLQSFDNVGGSANIGIPITSATDAVLNHFLKPDELDKAIKHSHSLAEPTPNSDYQRDPVEEEEKVQRHKEQHGRAQEALFRILNLVNASQKEKTRANVRRCIDIFGRHSTDTTLRPRAPTNSVLDEGKPPLPQKTPRAGPDTGSSEVQISILTVKIRALANQMEQPGGQKDKINKRNLRVMVHKRQKLLRYLREKERGGDRWRHLVEKLGLSEGTWVGEISL
ncbi:ribosomal protein-like protein S15 [Calycina marina]|uniref:Ribosomal protein-like protein S15 n=1 Tax=Calycina marina TaxID=1763456 RepID=A0A9P8CGJ3_9HELO|nr:ribosomal protein-like protein S15 [Calycina marina]